MALQRDCHVTVTESTQHHLNPDSASPTEILTLRVDSINPAVTPFNIKYVLSRQNCTSRVKTTRNQIIFPTRSRLNSTEYAELREKLRAPIRNSPNVVIHQTLSELFLETFKAQVDLNQPYVLPRGQVHFAAFIKLCPVLR